MPPLASGPPRLPYRRRDRCTPEGHGNYAEQSDGGAVKLVLHIGTPKTASTLLQNSCEGNPDWLARHGLAYGRALAPDANHITLFFAAAITIQNLTRAYGIHTLEELADFRTRLIAEIRAHRDAQPAHIHTMIYSTENLTGNLRSPDGVAQLREMLAPLFDTVEIVVYIRRQDDAILSMYGEFMRRGFAGPLTFPVFLDRCLSETSFVPYVFYRRELEKWINVWGRDAINVRLFDRKEFIGGDILTDFMSVVLGRTNFDMSDFQASPADNRGLSAPVLEALRRLQPSIPFMKDGRPNPVRELLLPFINTLPTEPRPVMSAERAGKIMAHFEASNLWVQETFFPGRAGPLFAQRPDHPSVGNMGLLDIDQFAEISGQLLTAICDPAGRF